MRIATSLTLCFSCLLTSLACSSESDPPSEGTGAAGGSGGSAAGASGSAGLGGSAGQAPGTGGGAAGTGQAGTGGSANGGTAGTGGTGGEAAGGGGTAGSESGGSGGTGGSGGDGGSATPSPGCGTDTAKRPADGKIYVAGESWLLFPQSYDGTTPLPVLFGFHGCGTGNRGDASRTEYTDLTNNTAFATEYIRAIPLSADNQGCWNYNTDIVRVKALYDKLANEHCIDTSRVFATGHSSGAQFIVQILSGNNHTADAAHFKFKGVAPVAASAYGPVTTPTAIMYIQNVFDTVRNSSGKDVVDLFVAGNSCSMTSMPLTVDGAGCNSGGTTVNPGCVKYDGCDVPTIWCSHNDPAYSNTGHGVPCFTAKATDEFFKSLD
jgi:polyhydroxybutyrate depolymerase